MAAKNKGKTKTVAPRGDGNVIGDGNTTDNSKHNKIGCFTPIFLTGTLTLGVTLAIGISTINTSMKNTSLPPVSAGGDMVSETRDQNVISQSQIKISTPRNDSSVERRTEISGTFQSLSPEQDLWIYVYATEEGAYYPGKVNSINYKEKTWSFPGIIGNINPDQAGNKWRIGVFVVGKQTSEILKKSANSGMPKLPIEVDSSKEITITRKPNSR
jgi:hypothetical protein